MASVKSIFLTIVALALVVAVTAGGVYGWQMYQKYTASKTIQQAELLIEEGKPLEADTLLNVPKFDRNAQALAIRMRALEEAQDSAALAALGRRMLNADKPLVQPGDEAWARAQLAIGLVALESGQAEPAREAFEAILAEPDAYGQEAARFGLARLQLSNPAEFAAGEAELEALIARLPEADPLRPRVEGLLGQVHLMRLMDRQPQEGDEIYVIARGDTIDGMSRRFKVSKELIMRVNGIGDPKLLTIGRRIKIPNLEFSIVVNKSDNTLTLMNHGKFFKKYRVRTGESDYMTPSGDYTIGRKVENPPWKDPKSRQDYGPGEEGNELGARWMGFQENPSIGIHEAVDPTTVGTYGSNGCVGLAEVDIIELYDLVRVGTPVKIVGSRTGGTSISLGGGANTGKKSPAAGKAKATSMLAEPEASPAADAPVVPLVATPEAAGEGAAEGAPEAAEQKTLTPSQKKAKRP